jgi:hypothetical protein
MQNDAVMQARLKVLQDNANLKQIKLLPITVIGRGADCQLKIASTQVSRRHCCITVTENDVLIEDLNSANGTYVNQEKSPPGKRIPVAPGTTLHIGPAAFVVEYTPPYTLETMPTTVIKSSELPFLKEIAAAAGGPKIPPSAELESNVLSGELPSLAPPPDEPASVPAPAKLEIPQGAPAAVEQPASPELSSADEATVEKLNVTIESSAPPPMFVANAQAVPEAKPPAEEERPALPLAVPLSPPKAATVAPPKGIPVASPAVMATPVVAKAVPVSLPPTAPAEETVTMFGAGQETVMATPPVSATPPGSAFDFLGGTPSPSAGPSSFDEFNFSMSPAAPVAPIATGTPAKPPAGKKSLFGMFGKKEKPAVAPAAPPATPTVSPSMPIPPAPPVAAGENPFAFTGEAAPAPGVAAPVGAAPAAPAVPQPADAPASPPADDPFAFLK